MTVVATGVADFSATNTVSDSNPVIEPDDILNVDASGEVVTSFTSQDPVWFWVHHAENLEIDRVACTDQKAMITDHGVVRRSRTVDLVFTGVDDVALPYFPAGPLRISWEGAIGGGVEVDGLDIEVRDNLPCACVVTVPIDVHLFCLQPGHTKARVVAYLKERSA